MAHYFDRFDWLAIELKTVRVGDLYANGGTVTASRKAQKGEAHIEPPSGRWTIKCSKSWQMTAMDHTMVIVGRIKQAHP